MALNLRVQLTEPGQPESYEVGVELGLGQLFLGDSDFQFLLLGLQGFQAFFCGTGQDTDLDGIEHILDASFGLLQLLFQEGQRGIFLILKLHHHFHNGVDGLVILEHLQGGIYHQVFQPDLADRFLFAASCALGIGALVIVVDNLVPAGAALTKHHSPAHPAEQLGGKQIVVLCFVPGRGPAIFLQSFPEHGRTVLFR